LKNQGVVLKKYTAICLSIGADQTEFSDMERRIRQKDQRKFMMVFSEFRPGSNSTSSQALKFETVSDRSRKDDKTEQKGIF
jgi:hypothetical protein